MSIQSISIIGMGNIALNQTLSDAQVGDRVVSVVAINATGSSTPGGDFSSYYESTISTAGEIAQTTGATVGIYVMVVLARGN